MEELWHFILISIPALYLGFYLGEKFFQRMNAEIFKKISLGMVFLSSLALMGAALFQ